jgi:histidinol-phosphatase (PHP family)
LLIGFETEWIRNSSFDIIRDLQSKYKWDFFVGSVHHVHTIPIDFDRPWYEKAREKAGGSDMKLFEDYFNSQFEMLQALKPPVVGHFDLVRLLSDSPNIEMKDYPHLWAKVQRNLEFIHSYDGILEINTSALRKGLKEAYPAVSICRVGHINQSWCITDRYRLSQRWEVALHFRTMLMQQTKLQFVIAKFWT